LVKRSLSKIEKKSPVVVKEENPLKVLQFILKSRKGRSLACYYKPLGRRGDVPKLNIVKTVVKQEKSSMPNDVPEWLKAFSASLKKA